MRQAGYLGVRVTRGRKIFSTRATLDEGQEADRARSRRSTDGRWTLRLTLSSGAASETNWRFALLDEVSRGVAPRPKAVARGAACDP